MKKTFKRTDGTEEVVEGTPEEIAEYENNLREVVVKKSKKPVLRGAEVDGTPLTDGDVFAVRLSRLGLLSPFSQSYTPNAPPCTVCGGNNCAKTHITYKVGVSDSSGSGIDQEAALRRYSWPLIS